MSIRLVAVCGLAALVSPSVRADDVRWRHVATRGDKTTAAIEIQTFQKPAAGSQAVVTSHSAGASKPAAMEASRSAAKPPLTAVIRSELATKSSGTRDALEREIGVECSRLTREYAVQGDAEGRIVVDVVLRSIAEWNGLVARIRLLPDLGSQAVILRGRVP